MSTIVDYTNISSIKDHWIKDVAPLYFDMDDVNNYQVGIFGYANEIMAEVTEDTHQAITIARREFYPTTAQYKSSIHQMAALQQVSPPMATPATAKAILILNENEIIQNATFENGMYKFVLDNTMQVNADDKPFAMDYPVVILAKKIEGGYSYTCHYDVNRTNSLSTSTARYLPNKSTVQNGVRYLLMEVNLRQVTITNQSKIVTKDSVINTIVQDFVYDGELANFEVYYKESDTAKEIQLEKVPINASGKTVPFCFYELRGDNIIRLQFTSNGYFTPVYNSTIRVEVYTTLGEGGNFKVFEDDLQCTMQSSEYSYNNTITVVGKVTGPAEGGKAQPTFEEYTQEVQSAYTTNKTFTTYTDIQDFFNTLRGEIDTDSVSETKILFRKKRDDPFIRLFGSYALMKDKSSLVIPTNTLNLKIHSSAIVPEGEAVTRIPILPGQLFAYLQDTDDINYTCTSLDNTISDDIATLEKEHGCVFVNPFLIMLTLNPNIVGFYLNSIDARRALTYDYVNDKSHMQFIAHNLNVYRNAMLGDNFYKFSVTFVPTSDIKTEDIVDLVDTENPDNNIRATQNGVYTSCKMIDGKVTATVVYDDGSTKEIIINSRADHTNNFEVTDGFTMQLNVGDSFIEGNVIAIKKPHDKGKVRALADFENVLIRNKHYMPMYIEAYNESTGGFTMCGYLATDDNITLDSNLLITSGVHRASGEMDDNVSIPMQDLVFACNLFYKDDNTNYAHEYVDFAAVKSHTLTNMYSINIESDEKINLIKQIDYIRSVMTYSPGPNAATDTKDYYIEIDEVPVLRAAWAKSISNYEFFVDKMYNVYNVLQDAFIRLKNNYSLDLKFFNTYGKAKFYQVGIRDNRETLDVVNCKLRLGVFLNTISNSTAVIAKIRTYIKEYIENINYTANTSKSIYILRMIADCTQAISEIDHMEYYGFNDYDHGVQSIEGLSDLEISENGIVNYIPEFININTIPQIDGTNMPDIEIILLNEEAV